MADHDDPLPDFEEDAAPYQDSNGAAAGEAKKGRRRQHLLNKNSNSRCVE